MDVQRGNLLVSSDIIKVPRLSISMLVFLSFVWRNIPMFFNRAYFFFFFQNCKNFQEKLRIFSLRLIVQ